MRSLEIIKQLEDNPELITEKLNELKERGEELDILERLFNDKVTTHLHIIQNVRLPAHKLIKVTSKLKELLIIVSNFRIERQMIKNFKSGKDYKNLTSYLVYLRNKWETTAKDNFDNMNL